MKGVEISVGASDMTRAIRDSVVIDCDDHKILGIEIIGYSHISGVMPRASDILNGAGNIISLGCDADSDVVSIQLSFGENKTQRTVQADMKFDDDGRLVHISIPDF